MSYTNFKIDPTITSSLFYTTLYLAQHRHLVSETQGTGALAQDCPLSQGDPKKELLKGNVHTILLKGANLLSQESQLCHGTALHTCLAKPQSPSSLGHPVSFRPAFSSRPPPSKTTLGSTKLPTRPVLFKENKIN